jgi:predicted transcriptional regulator
MSTLEEIRAAIAQLSAGDKALLTAELLALESEACGEELGAALERGLRDVKAGRVRRIEEVLPMLPRWIRKP